MADCPTLYQLNCILFLLLFLQGHITLIMLFSIGTVILALYQQWIKSRRRMRYFTLISSHIQKASSVVIKRCGYKQTLGLVANTDLKEQQCRYPEPETGFSISSVTPTVSIFCSLPLCDLTEKV